MLSLETNIVSLFVVLHKHRKLHVTVTLLLLKCLLSILISSVVFQGDFFHKANGSTSTIHENWGSVSFSVNHEMFSLTPNCFDSVFASSLLAVHLLKKIFISAERLFGQRKRIMIMKYWLMVQSLGTNSNWQIIYQISTCEQETKPNVSVEGVKLLPRTSSLHQQSLDRQSPGCAKWSMRVDSCTHGALVKSAGQGLVSTD